MDEATTTTTQKAPAFLQLRIPKKDKSFREALDKLAGRAGRRGLSDAVRQIVIDAVEELDPETA